MTHYLDRLQEEHDDLDGKCKRLKIMVTGHPTFKTLSPDEQADLTQQLIVMTEYRTILEQRMARGRALILGESSP